MSEDLAELPDLLEEEDEEEDEHDSSSPWISAVMSSGAIHRVEPAKKDVPPPLGRSRSSEMSPLTFESPKSVMMAFSCSSMRMLHCCHQCV